MAGAWSTASSRRSRNFPELSGTSLGLLTDSNGLRCWLYGLVTSKGFDYAMFSLILLNCAAMAYEYPALDARNLDGQILFWRCARSVVAARRRRVRACTDDKACKQGLCKHTRLPTAVILTSCCCCGCGCGFFFTPCACSDVVFTVAFTVEALLKVVAFGLRPYLGFFQNQVDGLIVVSSLVMLALDSLDLHIVKVCTRRGCAGVCTCCCDVACASAAAARRMC